MLCLSLIRHCLHSIRSRVYEVVWCPSVHMSVPAWAHSSKPGTADSHPAAVGLLLWALQAGYIDLLLQQQQVNAGSATLSVYVGG